MVQEKLLQVLATCDASSRQIMQFALNCQERSKLNCSVKYGQPTQTLVTGMISMITSNPFASNTVLVMMVGGGKVVFTQDQKQRISNMDETKFSMDGSDVDIGGRPTNSITIAGTTRYGTATNKASLSSTIVCGSTVTGEPLPIHTMFSSDAQE
jgi:hypothetical protein